jgi:hypothetical protein
MSKPFFLAKSGQIYGPYDRNEIESMRETGEYEKYTWFWDDAIARWNPIDPPPASPRASAHAASAHKPETKSAAQPSSSSPSHDQQPSHQPAAASPAWSVSEDRLRLISVLGHDHQNVANGHLAHVTDGGCEFIVTSHATSPDFQAKLPIFLHILDVPTGRSMNVSGRVGRVERRDGAWVYKIHWKRCPQILTEDPKNLTPRAENRI